MPSHEEPSALVSVIDDDENVRDALSGLFRSVGLDVELHESTASFLDADRSDRPGCLVLDVRLPGKSGIEFQEELVSQGENLLPIVFISGHADIAMSVRAMKAGAVEFLTKPVRDQDLLDAVHLAIEKDRIRRNLSKLNEGARRGLASLTPREREVLDLVVTGARNKEIANVLGLSEATIKIHRSHLMHKLNADSLVSLVRIADLHGGTESTKR